jgi:large subunit ribosomal protein L17
MRHRKAGRKLGMNQTARKAMFRNMVTSLVLHERIQTTEARAKELRRFADRVVSIAKRAPSPQSFESLSGDELQQARAQRVHAIRRARRWLMDDDALSKLFDEVAPRFADRPGGYTRVVKAGFRPGDNAPMAVIEFVEEEIAPHQKRSARGGEAVPSSADDAASAAASDEAAEE